MQRCFLFLFLFLGALYALPSHAQTLEPCSGACAPRHYYERQPLTRAAPTPGAAPVAGTLGSGMSMGGVRGVRISACAPAGQTFTGTGAFRAHLFIHTGPDPDWHRGDTLLDLSMRAEWNGRRCVVWPDFVPSITLAHWVLYAADAVGMTGTATVPALQNTVLLRLEAQL